MDEKLNLRPEIRMMTTVELAEKISTSSFVNGKSAGWQDAAKHLRKLAGEAFVAGEDDVAHSLREAAGVLELEVPKVQEEWRNRYHAFHKAYWHELEERQPDKAVAVGNGGQEG